MKHPARKTIGFQLMLAARFYQTRLAMHLAKLSLFPGQDRVLQIIAAEGEMTMGALAGSLRVRAPTMSKSVARLTAQGFIERLENKGDQRVVTIRLSAAGLALIQQIEAATDAIEAEIATMHDEKDLKRFRRLLRDTAQGLAGTVADDATSEDDL